MISKQYHTCKAVIYLLLPIAVALLFALSATSCRQQQAHPDEWYDTLFSNADRDFNYAISPAVIARIDSVYNHTPSPSPYFRFLRHSLLSKYYYLQGQTSRAEKLVDSQLMFMEKEGLALKYPEKYAFVLDDRGNYFYNAGKLDEAFAFYSRSRAVQLTMKDDLCTLSFQSYHLGMITFRQERYGDAANYFKQCLAESFHCQEDTVTYFRQQEIMNNIGLSYFRLKSLDSAKLYYTKALIFIDTQGAKYGHSVRYTQLSEIARGVVLGNVANVYIGLKQPETATQIFLQSIAINSKYRHENHDALYGNIELAQLYYNEKKYDKVATIINDIKGTVDTVYDPPLQLRWYHLLYQHFDHAGQPGQYAKYLGQYVQLKDSMDAVAKVVKRTDYSGLLKSQEAQYRIDLLSKDNELNKLYLWITIGLTFISLIIIAFIYYVYMRSRSNVLTLTSLNVRINEQKAQLENAMVQLKDNNEDKDRILRIVAHDLRTPINGIMMLGGFMLDVEDDVEKRDSLNMIISASKNLSHLTNELLEFSGTSRPITVAQKEDTELNELGRQVVGLLQFKAEEKGQQVTLVQAATPMHLLVYREKISRVLTNLITNAMKFSRKSGEIIVTIEQQQQTVLIKVQDNGIGIPEKLLPVIFDTFTSAKRHGTSGEQSFGLGLSICKQIVEAHNGRIWVESKEGVGSTFFIELPLEVKI